MNSRVVIFLLSIPLLALAAFSTGNIAASLLSFWLVAAVLSTPKVSNRFCATLITGEIMYDTLEALKVQVPFLFESISGDFSSATAKKDETITSHIRTLPAVQDYDATAGYEANNVEADALLTDVTVVMNRLKHVPVRVKYLTQLASKKNLYREAIADQAYVLGKSIVDYALSLVVEANFSHEKTEGTANVSLDTLEAIRSDLNTQGAMRRGRFGVVNTAVAQKLAGDSRIASKDYYGQLNDGDEGYRVFRGIAGNRTVWEYPDMPANGIDLTGFFADRRAIHVATRIPSNDSELAAVLNLPPKAKFETMTDPDTGLTLLGIYWQKDGTFDVWATIALLYGVTAGAQGGAADSKTDKAGIKLVAS